VFLGFVDEAYKFALMRHAQVFVHPSAFEALSIVLLEAMLSGAPALVNGNCTVMAEHCRAANAGFDYTDYESFRELLGILLGREDLRRFLGENGRRYVASNYSREKIARKLYDVVQSSMHEQASSAVPE
jgi:glycosyltransferase involved in cell wall biosynthesis